jgi:hypothetical protein
MRRPISPLALLWRKEASGSVANHNVRSAEFSMNSARGGSGLSTRDIDVLTRRLAAEQTAQTITPE